MLEFLGRILEILIAIAMLRSVLMAILRAFRGIVAPPGGARPNAKPPADGAQAAGASPSGGASPSTLLHQDPVCGTYVAAGSSFRKICRGKVFHFCSEECRDRYNA